MKPTNVRKYKDDRNPKEPWVLMWHEGAVVNVMRFPTRSLRDEAARSLRSHKEIVSGRSRV